MKYYIHADKIEVGGFGPKCTGDQFQVFDNYQEYINTLNGILDTQEESYMMGKTYTWCGNMINRLAYGVEETA